MKLPSVNVFLILTTYSQFPGSTVTDLRKCLDNLGATMPRHGVNMHVMRLVESGCLEEEDGVYPKQYSLTSWGKKQLKKDAKFFRQLWSFYKDSIDES